MERTQVGHCKRDETDVYIGRGRNGAWLGNVEIGERGWLGNPYPVDEYGREGSIEEFRTEFELRIEKYPDFRDAVRDLQGKTLGCWCQSVEDDSPACHGEVIAEWADKLGTK